MSEQRLRPSQSPRRTERSGVRLVQERKQGVVLAVLWILTLTTGAFWLLTLVNRGAVTDLWVFGPASLVFCTVALGFHFRPRSVAAANLVLIPLALLIPMSVLLPYPRIGNPSALYILAAGGCCSSVLTGLIGNRAYQLMAAGAVPAALTVLFYQVYLVPGFGNGVDSHSAFNSLLGSLLLQAIVISSLMYLFRLIGGTFQDVEQANLQMERLVEERTHSLQEANQRLNVTLTELAEAQSQLLITERMKALGELVAGVSHEINTPLGAIISFGETLSARLNQTLVDLTETAGALGSRRRVALARWLPQVKLRSRQSGAVVRSLKSKYAHALRHAHPHKAGEAAEDLAQLGPELLEAPEFSQMVRGDHGPRVAKVLYEAATLKTGLEIIVRAAERIEAVSKALRQNVDFRDPSFQEPHHVVTGLESVLLLMKHSFDGGVTLERRYDETVVVLCHVGRLSQVWMNLLQNAVQATGGKGKVRVEVSKAAEQATVEVTNTGDPVPEAVRERLFEPFVTTKDRSQGSGLGLAICKRIVTEHGGTISFTSGPKETCFRVSLPLLNT